MSSTTHYPTPTLSIIVSPSGIAPVDGEELPRILGIAKRRGLDSDYTRYKLPSTYRPLPRAEGRRLNAAVADLNSRKETLSRHAESWKAQKEELSAVFDERGARGRTVTGS
ncbi:hypothetical protein Q8F55_006355 [Vanrija albida]|uniref:Uncharacterized protein n=1 Tax=Vanrija albida TaxID=181172 RepID=A0ABR3PWU9_9TREE